MLLTIDRLLRFSTGTLGVLRVDGVHECFTKEPPMRSDSVFIAGESALPLGLYTVSLPPSRRYGHRTRLAYESLEKKLKDAKVRGEAIELEITAIAIETERL